MKLITWNLRNLVCRRDFAYQRRNWGSNRKYSVRSISWRFCNAKCSKSGLALKLKWILKVKLRHEDLDWDMCWRTEIICLYLNFFKINTTVLEEAQENTKILISWPVMSTICWYWLKIEMQLKNYYIKQFSNQLQYTWSADLHFWLNILFNLHFFSKWQTAIWYSLDTLVHYLLPWTFLLFISNSSVSNF